MKRFLSLLLCLTLALSACPRPLPGPDGGVINPTSVMSVVEDINTVLSGILPIALIFFDRYVPPSPAKNAVLDATRIVIRVAGDWQRAAAVYRERGGETCGLYAISGALTDSLISLARALSIAGVGWGDEIEQLIQALGLLTDRLIGRCQVEGVDAGALSWSGAVGDRAHDQLQMFRDQARARGIPLLRLPAMTSENVR